LADWGRFARTTNSGKRQNRSDRLAPLPDIHGGGDFLDARKARLDDVLEDIGTKTLRYVYDFGEAGST
jgi:hypothetical protein